MKWVLALLIGYSLQASANSTKYFKNPIKEDRWSFTSCAIEGALYGISQGKPESVACFAKGGRTEYLVFRHHATRKTYYYEITSNKFTGGAGDQAAGIQEYTLKVRQLEKDLSSVKPARVGTLKITSQWLYSEGSTVLSGRMAGTQIKVSFPLFNLSQLDEEIEQFKREL